MTVDGSVIWPSDTQQIFIKFTATSRLLLRILGRSSLGLSRNANDIHGPSSTNFGGTRSSQPDEMHLQNTQDHLLWLQSLCWGFRDRQPAPPLAAHAEILQAISALCGTTARRSFRPRAKGSHPITWTPELHKTFEECKASLSRATSVPFALVTDASTSVLGAVLQQRVQNAWQLLTSYPEVKPTAAPPPPLPPSTAQPMQLRPPHHLPRHNRPSPELHAPNATHVPCPLQQLSNHLRGVMWEPPTLNQALANHRLGTIRCWATAG
jgi:hypothetical protein